MMALANFPWLLSHGKMCHWETLIPGCSDHSLIAARIVTSFAPQPSVITSFKGMAATREAQAPSRTNATDLERRAPKPASGHVS